jgi:hypothetical protein
MSSPTSPPSDVTALVTSSAPIAIITPKALSPGAFQAYYTDATQLTPVKKISYLLMMAADLANQQLLEEYNTKMADGTAEFEPRPEMITPEKFVKATEPFNNLLSRRGFTKRLIVSKDVILDEYLRRNPTGKVNKKNTPVPAAMLLLAEYPLTDDGDISFIKAQMEVQATTITSQLQAEEEDVETGAARITKIDRLRFIVILTTYDDLMAAYLQHTDKKTVTEVDSRNSEKAIMPWNEMICELFNDETVEVQTVPLPDLHDNFREPIACPKGEYTLTPDKAKDLMSDTKGKLRTIISKYNMSGNGSDMAHFEDDSGDEDEGLPESDATYGRFNSARALRRAGRRKGMDHLKVTNGDDRRDFLAYHPPDILYWWHLLDVHNLLYFFMGKLGDNNSASCAKTPDATSSKKRKQDSAPRKQSLEFQEKMVANVAAIGRSVAAITSADLSAKINAYQRELFEMQMCKLSCTPNDPMIGLIANRIAEIKETVATLRQSLSEH